MNLIANTGIQLFTFSLEINLNDTFKMYFHEWYDTVDNQQKLEIAHYFSQDEVWVKKYDLYYLGFVKNGQVTESWENIKEDFEMEGKRTIPIPTNEPKDAGCFQQSISRIKWEKFENTWLPVPFFALKVNKTEFGPTNWCRVKFIPVEKTATGKKYNLLLAFDTRTVFEKEDFEDDELFETPVFTNSFDKSKDFALCKDELALISYCSKYEKGSDKFGNPIIVDCEWVDSFLLKLFHNIGNINDFKGPKPKLEYLTQYIFLMRYIQQLGVLPKLTLFSNKNVEIGSVDLVVDIGNSRTCAVLFDNGNFTTMSPLELQDFSKPLIEANLNKYRDSFDMRLAFREADFGGRLGIENSRQFVYPSLIRLGKEANDLIHQATNMNTGAEKVSTFSSPKRFLWDDQPRKQEWEFVQLEGEVTKPIYIEGISEQLNSDGSLNVKGHGGILLHYSRKALMTFAFLEILAQANMQINSYEQRSHWGNEAMPRTIRKIIVTCPTAMSRVEQIALRKGAENAALMVERFNAGTFRSAVDVRGVHYGVQVIPAAKNLSLNEERTEWIFDEATAAQFVFLYAEIKERYLNNVKDYFDFYGSSNKDLPNYDKKVITIGSVDIGAGTTDVMIATYKYDDRAGQCALTPVPRFWESFYLAGDDLLKVLVHQLVVEGKYSSIESKLHNLGHPPDRIVELLHDFFGGNTGMSFRYKQLRSDFNIQVSVPIVLFFLEILRQNKEESQILSYGDIFGKNPPTKGLLNHFKQHFGFDFETLQWRFERKIVSSIVEKTFDSLIGKISALISYFNCDILLLSGRPTSLKTVADIFLKYYAITPNRLKTMNDYRVGRWYPQDKRYKYVDGTGKFTNPKSIITTGAMIGHIAENGGLNGFALNLSELKQKLLPTTNFFGDMNNVLLKYTHTIISPKMNSNTIEIFSLPFRIGVRQLEMDSYPARPFYFLDFNYEKIEDRVMGRIDNPDDAREVQIGVEELKRTLLLNKPLKVTLFRDIQEDIEQLKIEEITDNEGNDVNVNFFKLQIQSLSEVENFWLDSGIFSINISKNF